MTNAADHPSPPPAHAARGRLLLACTRAGIDGVDGGLLLLLAARARLARSAGACKRGAGLPMRDPAREAAVRRRAEALGARLGLRAATARAAVALATDEAYEAQGIASRASTIPQATPTDEADVTSQRPSFQTLRPALRLLPPPARWRPLLAALPPRVQRRLLETAMARVLAAPLAEGHLDFMRGRTLGIEVTDLGLRWVVEGRGDALAVVEATPEASVRGTATDLLLLASRLEDADTLFFQRRLVLTGDTELGLTARNLLERLPWESVPLALRIVLNRGARLARSAREAHRVAHPAPPASAPRRA